MKIIPASRHFRWRSSISSHYTPIIRTITLFLLLHSFILQLNIRRVEEICISVTQEIVVKDNFLWNLALYSIFKGYREWFIVIFFQRNTISFMLKCLELLFSGIPQVFLKSCFILVVAVFAGLIVRIRDILWAIVFRFSELKWAEILLKLFIIIEAKASISIAILRIWFLLLLILATEMIITVIFLWV